MVTIFKIAGCLSVFVLLIELISLTYSIYHSSFIKKDRNKFDIFFNALGDASLFTLIATTPILYLGYCMWGSHDESGLAWLLMFLVLFIPFILFSIFFYIGRSEIFKMEQAQKDQDSESIER